MQFLRFLNNIGFRTRFVIFLAVAFTPIVLLLASTMVFEYRLTLESARRDVGQLAGHMATEQATAFRDARTFLDTLRRLPEVSVAGGDGCRRLLASLGAANPQFHTIGVADRDQMIVCHNTLQVAQKFGSPKMMAHITRPDAPEFNVGEFIVGKVSKKPTVVAVMKLPAVDGVSPGVVFVSMNLSLLSKIAGSDLSESRTAALLQMPVGKLLAGYPSMEVPFGSVVVAHPIIKAMQEAGSIEAGYAEGVGQDGRDRLFGYAPVKGVGEAQIVASVGVPRAEVFAPVNDRAILSALTCLAVLIVTCLGTWWIGYWMQLRPISRLRKISHLIAEGDLKARATIERWQAPELRALGSDFDAMAAKLEEGRRAEKAVAESEARYRILAESTSDLVTSLDAQGQRVFVSPACRELLGKEPEELFSGRPEDIAHPDDLHIVEAMMAKVKMSVAASGVQYRVIHKDGHAVWVEVGAKPLGLGKGTVLVIRDISVRKRAEIELAAANVKLAQQANTDGLTGLGNRRSFDARLQAAFDASIADRGDLSLILIDVDWFKRFNDTYGHLAGDECLRLISSTIGAAVRNPGDHAARFGGEEIALILPDTSVGDAIERAESVRQAVEAMNLAHAGSDYGHVTISIGVVSIHAGLGFSSPDEMLRSADQALYEVKASGRNALRYAISLAIKGENRAVRLLSA